MALDHIHLRKLLKIFFLEPNKRRAEILKEIAREGRTASSGGDFYGPFWSDAKNHALGINDLHVMVDERITANATRRNLYPRLRDGFLLWWNERRRWTNLPFSEGQWLKSQHEFETLQATVKVENLLCVRDGLRVEHVVYPYFSPEPVLSDQAARLGLWLLIKVFPNVVPHEIRILDVIRGQTFSIDNYPLLGDEEQEFELRYAAVLREREEIISEAAA